MLLTRDNAIKIQALQDTFTQTFEMTDLGIAHDYLEAEYEYHPTGIWIHQRGYIRKLLDKFRMQNCTTSTLRMDPRIKLHKDMKSNKFDFQLYRFLVKSLIYITNTRPDIYYVVSCVSRYIDNKVGDSLIDWLSKLQPTVLLSTTEAEYRVLTDTSKDVLYLCRLLEELGTDITHPTPILSDNQLCIKLVDNPMIHARTKHIEIQHHFIQE